MNTSNRQPLSQFYVLGKTESEAKRLNDQSQLIEEFTRRILHRLEIREGMSCLDVGCGSGDVMRLLGQMVGSRGDVTGLDINDDLGRSVVAELNANSQISFAFIEGDVNTIQNIPLHHYDITLARLLLLHQVDPVATLRRMWEWTKPGGYLVVIDYDMQTMRAYPDYEPANEMRRVIFEVLEKTGKDPMIGHKLGFYLETVCGAQPDWIDTWTHIWTLSQMNDIIASTYKSLVPAAVRLGVTTEEQAHQHIAQLTEFTGSGYYWIGAMVVGAFKRKPKE
jgi:ubiquinone/menaquinone biosynthesis C-methylase UbiE